MSTNAIGHDEPELVRATEVLAMIRARGVKLSRAGWSLRLRAGKVPGARKWGQNWYVPADEVEGIVKGDSPDLNSE